jgi:DNA-binding transcriptional LysR family regulator
MDRFEDLQAFIAVVETGSFTAAADRLDTAKSAVSRRISGLEQRLGVQLLRRTTRRLDLTDSGRSFYERSARILADLEEAESAVAQSHGELRGRLRVALPLSFGLRHMSAPIASFQERHPHVDFDLDLNDRRIDLLEEGRDLAVRIGLMRDSTLIARKLFEVKSVVCASPAYLRSNGAPESIASLQDHPCLVYGNLADPGRWHYTGTGGEERVVRVKVALTANSGEMLCSLAMAGRGLTMLPTFIVHEAIRRGELLPVLTDTQWPVLPAYAVYPAVRHLSYRVREFIDFLVETFSGTPYWDKQCDEILDRSVAQSPGVLVDGC